MYFLNSIWIDNLSACKYILPVSPTAKEKGALILFLLKYSNKQETKEYYLILRRMDTIQNTYKKTCGVDVTKDRKELEVEVDTVLYLAELVG